MSEQFREEIDNALERAVGGDADLDEIERALADAQDRVAEIRVLRGEA